MRLALLGNGKTGSRVNKIASEKGWDITLFNRSNPPGIENLVNFDVAISFLPGPAFLEYLPVLMKSGIPLISGSTGFSWPGGQSAFADELAKKKLHWVYSGNFSTGNSIVLSLLEVLSRSQLDSRFTARLEETHHIHKIDAPSGTALLWKEKLGMDIEIKSIRSGDEIGTHQLELSSPFETITITHNVLNRDVFAQGALLAAELLFSNRRRLKPGLYDLQQLMQINYLS